MNNLSMDSLTVLTHRVLGMMLLVASLLVPMAASADEIDVTDQGEQIGIDPVQDGWSLNLTPVLLLPEGNYRLGGGADPEIKYTVDLGRARLSAGARIGAYYAKNLFGMTLMPTLRLTMPVGPVEPYVSFGMGYGWLPKSDHAAIATMSRLGIVFRFSESFALGIEGTVQQIEGSAFRFPSFGSMASFDL
jgi:hypothetical protein